MFQCNAPANAAEERENDRAIGDEHVARITGRPTDAVFHLQHIERSQTKEGNEAGNPEPQCHGRDIPIIGFGRGMCVLVRGLRHKRSIPSKDHAGKPAEAKRHRGRRHTI